MKEHNYLQKSLLIVTAIAFILCTLVTYFSWKSSQNRQAYENAQNELNMTQESLQIEYEQSYKLNKALEESSEKLAMANTTISNLKSDEYEFIYLGDFKLTHYCTEPTNHICGTGDGITSSGTQIIAGRSVAVDPTIIPYGSQLYIEGYGFYIAEDSGGAVQGEHIDIAVETHEQALNMGITSGGVWILVKKS